MKKQNHYSIQFTVKLIGSTKIIPFNQPNLLKLKELAIIICKKLDIDRFNTSITFYNSDNRPLNIIQNLEQIQLNKNDTLYAKVKKSPIIPKNTGLYEIKDLSETVKESFNLKVKTNPKEPKYFKNNQNLNETIQGF